MTQEDYKLWTGESMNYADADWQKIVDVAEARLLRFLCLSVAPVDGEGNTPNDFAQLLANFISAMIARQGNTGEVSSKSVRNFSITFTSSAADAFAQIAKQYGDTIEKYSNCDAKIAVEKNTYYCCGGW